MMITSLDEPAETALTVDEIDMLMRRGAARVVVERSPQGGGGVTAIGVQMRRGEAPYNLLLFRVSRPNAPTTDPNTGRSIAAALPTLDTASPANRDKMMERIARRVQEKHDDLPPNDDEPEEQMR
jgi:hypothetical protein